MAEEKEVAAITDIDEESPREKFCFTDSRNRVWKCKLSGYKMYLFGNMGITLETFNKNELTIGQLMDLVYLSCESQLPKRRETKQTFMDLLEGDVFEDAMEAVGDALINFFRSPRAEKATAKALKAEAKVAAEAREEREAAAEESAENQDPETTNSAESGTGETTST